MNLCGRFYVKSTYIKAAKENWVLCDVRLLTDDTDTFLCIKSLPFTFENEKNIFAADNALKEVSEKKQKIPSFTALCNLSEYKSCSVRTVTVNNRDSFALKLVPSGVFGNKQLLIASVDENEITTWLAICRTSIGKKIRSSQNTKDNFSTLGTLSKAGSFTSLKPSNNSIDIDFDDGVLENEVYEAYSSEDKIPALVEEIGDWMKLHLAQPECYLRLTEERLEVLDAITEKPVQWFPYLLIRRFGTSNGVLRVDAGRRCSTGDGRFFFRCSPPNGQPVDMLVTQIRQLALEAKQRLKRSQLASSNGSVDNAGSIHADGMRTLRPTSGIDRQVPSCASSTMPRSRLKRQKTNSRSPDRRTNNGAVPYLQQQAPKASSESADELDKVKCSVPLAMSASIGEEDIVTACPGKATPTSSEQTDGGNVYDNVPRSPRKGSRLPGAVNVLPLPIRARSSSEANSHTQHEGSTTPTSVNTTPAIARASNLSNSRKVISTSSSLNYEEQTPLEHAPPAPNLTNESLKTTSVISSSCTQSDIRRSSVQSKWPNRLNSPSTNSDMPNTASVTTAVMRVPPFASPKLNSPSETKPPINICNPSSEISSRLNVNNLPTTLSHILDNTTNSTTLRIPGPHPSCKKTESQSYTNQVKATPGVAAMISRFNGEANGQKSVQKIEPISQPKRTPTPLDDDTKDYLSELDNVIQELCKANEAAVQATREAARRRHQIGWPVAYKSLQTEENFVHTTEKT